MYDSLEKIYHKSSKIKSNFRSTWKLECIFVGQMNELVFNDLALLIFRFLLFGKGQTWNIPRIEETFMKALTLLKPDEACLSHAAISRLIELGTETIDEVEWSTVNTH